jgi:ankyrin repeat protein
MSDVVSHTAGSMQAMIQKTITRAAIGAALLPLALLVAINIWRSSRQSPSTHETGLVDRSALARPLLTAIRDGDHSAVRDLLQQGADANARNDGGDTALMCACLNADLEIVRLLIDNAGDLQAHTQDGITPLVRAVHDRDKVRLLLERGARVDSTAVVAAARVPGSKETLELLFAHGGSGRAAIQGFTALMAASGNGDFEAVSCLLSHGADVNACMASGHTALIGAAVAGDARCIGLLLDRGADPNAVCELPETGAVQTAAMVAATLGYADCLRILLERGADARFQGGPFKQNALLGAATTASLQTIRLLLPRVDVNATDWNGNTPLDWAERRGETDIVKALRAAGAEKAKAPAHRDDQPPMQRTIRPASVQRAVSAALPPLQQSEQTITQTRNCVTCHQHSLVAMTAGVARKHGFMVNETIAAEERLHVLKDLDGRANQLLLGTGIDPVLSVYALAGLAGENEPPSRATDAVVHYLVLRQREDGRWPKENYRPPSDGSEFQFTALAVRGLQAYAPKGRSQEISARIGKARNWLKKAAPADTIDAAFRLLGLVWAHADRAAIGKAVTDLAQQRADGGWSQLPTLPSDAYATGLALYALHEAGTLPVNNPAYRRGVDFLLRTQLADGSWFVPTRSFPLVEYSKSGFPHGRSQFISAAGTCWAVMALSPAGAR